VKNRRVVVRFAAPCWSFLQQAIETPPAAMVPMPVDVRSVLQAVLPRRRRPNGSETHFRIELSWIELSELASWLMSTFTALPDDDPQADLCRRARSDTGSTQRLMSAATWPGLPLASAVTFRRHSRSRRARPCIWKCRIAI
jgi:hypothetical protein